MRWWLASHRPVIAVIIGATAVIASVVLGDARLLMPTASGNTPFGSVPLFAILPLAVPITFGALMDAAERPPYAVSARPVYAGDVALIIVGVMLFFAVGVVLAVVWPTQTEVLPALRNVAGLVGLQLLVAPWLHYRYQALVPTLYVFAAATFGRAGEGRLSEWAWPVETRVSPLSLGLGAALLLVGTVLALLGGGRRGLRRW